MHYGSKSCMFDMTLHLLHCHVKRFVSHFKKGSARPSLVCERKMKPESQLVQLYPPAATATTWYPDSPPHMHGLLLSRNRRPLL